MCEGPKNYFPVFAHVLGIYEFESLGNLGIWHIFAFPKVVGEFLVYLVV